MIYKTNLIIKSILIVLFMSIFLEGAEDKVAPKELRTSQDTPKALFDWRIFGGVGFGGTFGDRIRPISSLPYLIKITPYYVSGYVDATLGTEFIFRNGNGFNAFLDMEGSNWSIGANYVYELRGDYKFAFMSGFAVGTYFNETKNGYVSPSYFYKGALAKWNLSARYRFDRQALSLNLKVPLNEITITDNTSYNTWLTPLYKEYTGVAISIGYTYFFKL